MHPYDPPVHGGDRIGYRERFPGREPLDFSANVSPLSLPGSVRAALVDSLDEAARYPDPLCRELRAALAAYEGVPAGWILPGAGAAELIWRLARTQRPGRALLLCPTFAEYELALCYGGWTIDHHPLDPARGFLPDDSLVEAVAGHDLVLLCNPNNPTGALIDPALLRAVLRRCGERGALLAVDECFGDLVDAPQVHSLRGELAANPHLLLLRAFTKSHALPGLRLGWALCADRDRLAALARAGPPWSVSAPAEAAGIAAARDADYLERVRELIRTERPLLEQGLRALGLRVFPGAANFLLLHTGEPDLAVKLCNKGVLIRDCANFRGLGPGYYRVAVRTGEENRALLAAIKEVMP